MSRERDLAIRRRMTGEICCGCKTPLPHDPDHRFGERYCSNCIPPLPPKYTRVLMGYTREGDCWRVTFREERSHRPYPLRLTFADSDKIVSLFDRYRTEKLLEDRQAFEHGIESGRGMCSLKLTAEQVQILMRRQQ